MDESKEINDHTSIIAAAVDSEDYEDVQMILGDREKIRYAGVIRGGVKVPKKSCTADEVKLFKELEAQGMNYDDIDKKMGGTPKSATSKLTPRNVDHFVIRDEDFNNPADAQMLRQKYADADGFVRRIPVWFKTGDLERVIPHSFKSFDGGENLKATSFYKGDVLMCRSVPKGLVSPKKEDWLEKPCDPDTCSLVPAKKCTFGGFFRVNIPGIKGIGEIIVPTKSWYGLGNAVAVLKEVRRLQGRFNDLFQGQPFLELIKVPEVVKCPDGSKKTQFIITLDLSIDPMEIVRYQDPTNTALRGAAALRALAGASAAEPVVPVPASVSKPLEVVAKEKEKEKDEVALEPEAPVVAAAGVEASLPPLPPEVEASLAAIVDPVSDSDKSAAGTQKKSLTPISAFQKKLILKELAKKDMTPDVFNNYFLLEDVGDLDKALYNEAVEAINKGTIPVK